ncbi:ParB/RepB/Spo0J family partition protein [Deinococcus deserti]|uniref:Putative ParB-like partition protein n=1 Tax=Deinococcus deserti (strain DSM 17065 / CIP 109153 / LMG 22923 / VCD115) TaxID=546414 RepID=C1D2L4_DEIDV|nr:ParB/RepB/Spo0J family partition protein [Deinococcus deserti]ACO47653.1 putative ParB-like partition protein [Deinococcus deserti VCD115]
MAKRKFDATATLDALLGPAGAGNLVSQDQLRMLDVRQLTPTPHQPRTTFTEGNLRELADSIRENGVLQPILVRTTPAGLEIVAGERRWRAAQLAGLTTIPAYVRDLDDQQAAAASAVENLIREDLNPLEEVEAKRRIAALALDIPEDQVMTRLRRLLDKPEEDPDGVRELDTAFGRLGGEKWQSFLRNKGRILNLPEDVKEAVRGGLDYRKALVIGGAGDAEERGRLLALARDGATVQALHDAQKPPHTQREAQIKAVARALGQKRLLERISPRQQSRVDKLVAELHRILVEVDEAN